MKYLSYLAILVSSMLFMSCDQCKEVECLNNGTCIDGTCDCPLGFSGTLCEAEDVCLSGTLECQNDGECIDGECDCSKWYNGDECEDKILTRYEGTYIGIYSCNSNYGGTAKFSDVEEEDNLMVIRENVGRTYEATFSNSRVFDIENQTISDNNGILEVFGEGEATSASVSFTVTYDYSNQGSSTTCLFTGTK